MESIKKATAIATISLALLGATYTGAYNGLKTYQYHKFQELRRGFPSYVAEFEQRHGKFEYPPKLKFGPLEKYVTGTAEGDGTITIDNSLLDTTVFLTLKDLRDTVKHELSHYVIDHVIKGIITETNCNFVKYEGGKIYYLASMEKQFATISEGCACYIEKQHGADASLEYIGYYFSVKPILDELGVENGIKKLLLEPPTTEELKRDSVKNLDYYKRICLKVADN